MVKKPIDLRGADRLPSLRGQLYFSEWRGTIRINSWPKKTKRTQTPKLVQAKRLMKEASAAIKRMDGSQIAIAREISLALIGVDSPVVYHDGYVLHPRRSKTQALWRDVLFQQLYARMPVVIVTDIGKFRPVTALYDVSELLNTLSETPGAVLYRGTDYWAALPPGLPGQSLTLSPAGAPQWSAGGGGGSNWWFDPPNAAAFSLVSGDGTAMSLVNDDDAGLLFDAGAPVAGDVTRAAFQSIPAPSGDWQITFKPNWLMENIQFGYFGLLLRRTANGRCVGIAWNRGGSPGLLTLTSLTAISAHGSLQDFQPRIDWVRIVKTGTDLTLWASSNGKNWGQFLSTTTAAFLGGVPDQFGFGATYNRTSGVNITGAVERLEFVAL